MGARTVPGLIAARRLRETTYPARGWLPMCGAARRGTLHRVPTDELTTNPATVTLTGPAADKLREVMAAQRAFPEDAGLRVDVIHGGCSGFQYHLALDTAAADDVVVDHDGLRVLVGAESLHYVAGSTIDFTTTPHEGFVVNNPNAVAGCGCGSSFVMRDDAR